MQTKTKATLENENETLRSRITELETKLASVPAPAPFELVLHKGKSIQLETCNALLNRQRGRAGSLRGKVEKLPLDEQRELLTTVLELTGSTVSAMDSRSIAKLKKAGLIDAEDAARYRALSSIVQGFLTLERLG